MKPGEGLEAVALYCAGWVSREARREEQHLTGIGKWTSQQEVVIM